MTSNTNDNLPAVKDTNDEDAVTKAANLVAEDLDAKVFLYSGRIDTPGWGSLVSEMQPPEKTPDRPNSVLMLTTLGGFPSDAYRIARMMQLISDQFILCIPNMCKSAGTLIALGAHQIMMGDISEIGPLDVQLTQRDEIGQLRSGMVVRTALKGLAEETFAVFEKVMMDIKAKSNHTVSFEVSSKIASNIAAKVMSPIYAQIDPDSLGNDLRDLDIATAYGERLSKHGKNVQDGTIKKLVEKYPSHDFIIDKKETEALFYDVKDLTPEMNELMFSMGNEVYIPQKPQIVKRLDRITEDQEEQHEEPEPQTPTESDPTVDVGRQEKGNGNQGGGQEAGELVT